MRTLLIRSTLALACLAALPALAGTPIDQTRPLDARGRIEIENLKGRVEVRAWDRQEVKVTGTLGDGVEKFSMDGDRHNLRIEVKYPSRSGRTEPTVLIVQVPILAELEIETVSADIDVHGIASRELSLESVSGDIAANGAPREASVESVSGDVRLTLNSQDVSVDTVSGELVLQGRLNGEVSLETVSGNLRMDSVGERLRSLSAGSVSGDMDLKTGLADGGEIRLESVSGDLLLRLPRDLSAEVSGESFSGDLSAPGAKIQREEFGPGSSFQTRYGAGKGDVRMETFSGDATLRLQ
ncbi:DUF4097 family beta strand repeat-containing protein [Thermomonas carbonis]|uniref:DUF4097 family beta strand repeat protein n=1 Tax=Thermomonas carbonis TaxID=1463158 RepID=A0A7G9SRB5_9GAMM|nr:DUF4097 family beta strand repeat-containing protein [Thermomonas carbonis]QNN70390.1 DUF4097 family beta strand repeat protein [Thermomonas carbonis]GHB99695.1 hypothetical protein GCM10010080_10750 [Thermomonas carbonis]